MPHALSAEARALRWEKAQRRLKERGQYGTRSAEGKRKRGIIDHATAPFIAWDGEGVNYKGTVRSTHYYVFLANSDGLFITPDHPQRKGLRTLQILQALHGSHLANPVAIHVIYGGNYDFSQWLVDLGKKDLARLHVGEWVTWNGYGIRVVMGKRIQISFPDTEEVKAKKRRNVMTVYDVVSFFQSTFVDACDKYLHDRVEGMEFMRDMKGRRNKFTADDIPEMRAYNDIELRNLVALMNEFRDNVMSVDLLPQRWDGPGAIAETLLRREHVDKCLSRNNPSGVPPEVGAASRIAYAGGRFERLRLGRVDRRVVEYDVNSAYPTALRLIPNLARGRWVHVHGDPGDRPFALYHVRARHMDCHTRPGALFHRNAHGQISYPANVEGWFHSPEVRVLRLYRDVMADARNTWPTRKSQIAPGSVKPELPKYEILEAWVFEPEDVTERPFAFIDHLYVERQLRKARGDGSEKAIKLALNSLYGKLAQQLGWDFKRPDKIPAFHDLLMAGFTTSYCRAMVLEAALQKPESVIAFETDALFVIEPLDLDTSTGLGKWEAVEFEWLAYAQSGIYFGDKVDGKSVNKSRGIDRDTIDIKKFEKGMHGCDCKACMAKPKHGQRHVMHGRDTRFINLGLAFAGDFRKWNQWVTMDKTLEISPDGKRVHDDELCHVCERTYGKPWKLGEWHTTYCVYPHMFQAVEMNAPHPVMWEDWDGTTDINGERVGAMLARFEHADRKASSAEWGDFE